MAQFARPNSDIRGPVPTSSFVIVGGGTTCFGATDELVANDGTDYAQFSASNTTDTFQVGLSAVTDPASSSGHVVRIRVWDNSTLTNDWSVSLMQGGTTIAAFLAGGGNSTWTTFTYTLTAAEADAITDYAGLSVLVQASSSGSTVADYNCTWIEFEVPDAAIAFGAATSGTVVYPGNTNTLTVAHTVAAGNNRFMLIGVAWYNTQGARTVSTVTYNSVACTAVPSSQRTTPESHSVQLWSLVAPSTGTHDVIMTLSGNDDLIFMGVSSWSGVNQTTPMAAAVTNSAISSTGQLSFSSATNQYVVGHIAAGASGAAAFSTSNTQMWEIFDTTGNISSGAYTVGAPSVTLDWSGGTTSEAWVTSGVPLAPLGTNGPTIVTSPGSIHLRVGEIANFSVSATGTGVLHYQWARDFGDGFTSVGSDQNTYSFKTISADNNDLIKVAVTDDLGNVISNIATVFIDPIVLVPRAVFNQSLVPAWWV